MAVVTLPLLAAAGAAWSSLRDLEVETRNRLTRTVDLLHENTLRALESQEAYLTAINRFIMGSDWNTIASSPDVADFIARLHDSAPGTSAIGIISPAGQLVQTSIRDFPSPPIDQSFRDYVQAHQGVGVDAIRPVIGQAIVSRVSGRLVFPLSHARRNREGMPDGGVIWATSDVHAVARLYASIVIAPSDTVQLIRQDGRILVQHPLLPDEAFEEAAGRAEKMAVVGSAMRTGQIAMAYVGTAQQGLPAAWLGAERLVAARWLERYGIAVVYGLHMDQMRGIWGNRALAFAGAALVVVVLLLALIRLAQTGLKREYAALCRAQAEAARRLEAEIQLAQSARISALGQITAGVAHDMNNLIQSVMAASRLIYRRAEEPEKVRSLATMMQETAARGARIAARMLDFSRQGSARNGGAAEDRFDLPAALGRLEEMVGGLLGSGIRLTCAAEPGLPPLRADRAEFETVLVNLIVNARDAMPEGGAVRVTAGLQPAADGAVLLCVTVADTGTGMTPEVLRHAGEPFFTTKGPGRGTGLGLSLARQFAENLGGGMTIDSAPGQGTRVTLSFPA
ncbi:hybrid sensor histidine kinase/response regulator [Falsiroseomonas sp.]|uniref:hybrid sensor histidine kinase/response regulator n=1 Tax=Falsiroseomonas sp. TaxID=2870721 RepID=UPI002715FB8E|nr:hybrid sensor histidine kinase/response regulator [Falsiroseomonas sp.]MDO9502567.1 ATP-binding protein [Falsiroseomonas sp.]